MRLQDKVALITGAGSGIGRAIALLFAGEGAAISASDFNEATAKATVDSIKAAHGEAMYTTGDVAIASDVQGMVRATLEAYGRIDVLVSCAGIADRQLPSSFSPEEVWDRVMDVNLKGVYLLAWYTVPEMVRQGGGSIINLSSVMGLVGSEYTGGAGFGAYVPSKGGVLQFTKNLALEHAKNNIRVNCICPGYVDTNLTRPLAETSELYEAIKKRHPMGRFGRPEEIAYAALFLASDESSFVTGAPLVVDGGYTAQ
jgi:NAD(P)-dependent dehydrogenase (short-subunit alcohol dehydrogenase family)